MVQDRYFNYKKSQIEGFLRMEFQKKFRSKAKISIRKRQKFIDEITKKVNKRFGKDILFLIDFSADIYDQHVVVEFLARIREVRSFASSTELVDQMHEDLKVARRFFKTLHKSA